MLDSSEHSGSQLRSSKQPSVTQLNPFPPQPQPPPLFLSCQRGSCALQWAMFWVAEQGARPAQQLPLCIYIIWFFHLLFSIDCGLIWTGLMSLWLWFWIWWCSLRCLTLLQTTWPGLECCCGLPVFGSASPPVGSTQAPPPPLSFCLRSSQPPGALDVCKQPQPQLCQVQGRQKGQNEGTQQIRKHITLHNSQIFVWHEGGGVVWLQGFGPLLRKRLFICYIGWNGTGSSGSFKGFGGTRAAEPLIHWLVKRWTSFYILSCRMAWQHYIITLCGLLWNRHPGWLVLKLVYWSEVLTPAQQRFIRAESAPIVRSHPYPEVYKVWDRCQSVFNYPKPWTDGNLAVRTARSWCEF